MYKQFSHTTSICTSEREFKNKYLIPKYDSRNIFEEIYKNNLKKIWLPTHKSSKYFSYVPPLISRKTSIDYITNTKCCSPFHVYKKKGRYLVN